MQQIGYKTNMTSKTATVIDQPLQILIVQNVDLDPGVRFPSDHPLMLLTKNNLALQVSAKSENTRWEKQTDMSKSAYFQLFLLYEHYGYKHYGELNEP